ncbi:MAG: hypothetical protein ACNYPG_00350 [Candidatus Porifericomitaceae bacterium WSBS_2022_MAG_OTU9]
MGAAYFVEPLVNEARIANAQNQWQPLSPCDNCINTFYLKTYNRIEENGIDYCFNKAVTVRIPEYALGKGYEPIEYDVYLFREKEGIIFRCIFCECEIKSGHEVVVRIMGVVCKVKNKHCFQEPPLKYVKS